MDWSTVGIELLKAGLPTLGNLLLPGSGPLVNMAVQTIANKLGVAPTPEAVQAAVAADPVAAKLALTVEENNLSMFQAEVADRANARSMLTTLSAQKSPAEWTPIVLSYLIVILWAGFIAALFYVRVDIPERLYNLLYIGFGTTSTMLGIVVNFWFGTSRGAQKSADTYRTMAAANSNGPVPGLARATA